MDSFPPRPALRNSCNPELRDSGILVTNPSGIFSVPMAEPHHGPAHRARPQFSGFRSLSGSIKVGATGSLGTRPQHLTELNGQVLLVVGYGFHRPRIGSPRQKPSTCAFGRLPLRQRRCVARRKKSSRLPSFTKSYRTLTSWSSSRPRNPRDHAPHRRNPNSPPAETHGHASSMSRVAPCSINPRYSPLIQQRKIAGAALDVTDPEPLPAADPLVESPQPPHHPAHQRHQRPPLARAKPLCFWICWNAGSKAAISSIKSISTAATSGAPPHFECESEALALQSKRNLPNQL